MMSYHDPLPELVQLLDVTDSSGARERIDWAIRAWNTGVPIHRIRARLKDGLAVQCRLENKDGVAALELALHAIGT